VGKRRICKKKERDHNSLFGPQNPVNDPKRAHGAEKKKSVSKMKTQGVEKPTKYPPELKVVVGHTPRNGLKKPPNSGKS